jgi:uncharacterized protein
MTQATQATPPAKPILPTVTALNKPFWEGCRQGRLLVQKCTECGELRYPAAPVCPNCLGPASEWHALSGGGQVFSFTVFHRVYHPAWAEKAPYNVALIELDEGVMMFSNVVDIANERVAVGMRVKVRFDRLTDEIDLPVFVAES